MLFWAVLYFGIGSVAALFAVSDIATVTDPASHAVAAIFFALSLGAALRKLIEDGWRE